MSDMEEEVDPFDAETAPYTLFIVQARIYDTLMAMLNEMNPQAAKDLLEVHAGGTLVGPLPYFNGTFVTNVINEPEEEEEIDGNSLN